MENSKNIGSGGKPDSMSNTAKGNKEKGITIGRYSIEGLSIAGHETCIIFESMNLAFDIGRCPPRAVFQEFLFISHGHLDHIGGLFMYVWTRELNRLKPPTIFVPNAIKDLVEKHFKDYREMNKSELKHTLIGLDVGDEFQLRNNLKVRAFKTYHVVPSLGYVVYSLKQNLKQEYVGLSGKEIKDLKLSGVEITNTVTVPEIAFTGDTMSDFIVDETNHDVLSAKILVMESTFLDHKMTIKHARDHGHTHLFEIISHADKFKNDAILLIHFSNRYKAEEIQKAVTELPAPLAGRVYSLTEGF